MNNYSYSAKSEIAYAEIKDDEQRLAFLSAVIHTCASVFFSSEGLRVEINADFDELYKKVERLLYYFYKFRVEESKNGKIVILGEQAQALLFDCGIFGIVGGEVEIVTGIADVLIESEENKIAYLKGAFLGCGSVSLKIGYHLEFLLSNSDMAKDIGSLLDYFSINNKITVHNGKYVVYVRDNESVSDCLALMGANQAVIALNNEVVLRDIRKNSNRINNCEVANIEKTVNASVKQCEAVRTIEKKLGLTSLNKKLIEMAQVRVDNPSASFADIAQILNLPKSTVKNRLNKLVEIADKLNGKGENNG